MPTPTLLTLALLAISSYAPAVTARSRCAISSPSAAASSPSPVAQTSSSVPASSPAAAIASASKPASSPAALNVAGPAKLVAASTSGALSALKYTNVGGSGTYDQVTDIVPGTFPTCSANPFCVTKPKAISGNLAPFDDEMTVVFRGPMNIYNIAVYQPANANGTSDSASWAKVSSWAADEQPENLVFMNNNGGSQSGEWSICAGASQSYANGAWTDATTAPNKELAKGALPDGHEINIMTAESCKSAPCAGFTRGTANHGWAGSKFFVVTFDMPSTGGTPAIWALNAQIVRAAQYGCNCRGVGPGGCGELDIVETLATQNANHGISEIYAPKGATGSGASFFARPATEGERATFGVIFDVASDSIAIQRYASWDYDAGAVQGSAVEGYLGATAKVVDFGGGDKRRSLRYVFYPVTFFIGVPRDEILRVAELLATKLVENEFVAYLTLKEIMASENPLSPRSYTIASYALCGFANFGSLGIQIGMLSALAPSRARTIARIAGSAMICGFISTLQAAGIAAMLVSN